jgi:hypothetical protein
MLILVCLISSLQVQWMLAERVESSPGASYGFTLWPGNQYDGAYPYLPHYMDGGYGIPYAGTDWQWTTHQTRIDGVVVPNWGTADMGWIGAYTYAMSSRPIGSQAVGTAVIRRLGPPVRGELADRTIVPINTGQSTTITITTRKTGTNTFTFTVRFQFPTATRTWTYHQPSGDGVTWHQIYHFEPTISYHNPVFVNLGPLERVLGTPTDLTHGITGRWGYTSANTIPLPAGNGTITVADNQTHLVRIVTSNDTTYDRIGVTTLSYILRDAHSLSTAPLYAGDTTSATGSRSITVRTSSPPTLTMNYASGSVDRNGVDISGNVYPSADSMLAPPCGGEEGWTNQDLDVSVDPSGILGTFSTVLQIPTLSDVVVSNAPATYPNYNMQTSLVDIIGGTPVTGFLSELGNVGNLLSGVVSGRIKLDTTLPVADANYIDGFAFTDASTDDLSGISTVGYPTQIAFTAPSASTTPPTTGWEDMDSHTMNTANDYDVWVRATDKAGNVDTRKVFSDVFIGGEVSIQKDTDIGAVLHVFDCLNATSIRKESDCAAGCSVGATPMIEEESVFAYILTLTNRAQIGDASGTFEDYLPEDVIVLAAPTVTPAGSATVSAVLQTTGPYTGRWLVSGSYADLAPNAQIEVGIQVEAPAYDNAVAATNIICNQASTTWSIGTGGSPMTGTNLSNHALHAIQGPGVETSFTKVGADDLSTGLIGAEFALYRWDGMAEPTIAERNHMVDVGLLVDSTLVGGDWTRITYDGEDATSTNDVFVSKATPQGEVDLGSLEEGIYTLIETKAPVGYGLPIGQWILTINPSKGDTGAGDYRIEFVGKSHSIMPPAAIRDESVPNAPTYKIINARPFLIGLSGLGGTTGMLLTGFVIMAIAGNIYFVQSYKKYRKKEKHMDTY